jgi:hypothetical protein
MMRHLFFTIEPILAKAVTTVSDLFWPVMKGKLFKNLVVL